MSATKRINRELEDIRKSSSTDQQNLIYSVAPTGPNLFHWDGYIFGPEGSPYQGGAFKIDIKYPPTYPFKALNVSFKTKIYHPNIGTDGTICLDILKDKWSPALTMPKVLMSISSLLTDPNPTDPLEPVAAAQYERDKPGFNRKAREWTIMYATS